MNHVLLFFQIIERVDRLNNKNNTVKLNFISKKKIPIITETVIFPIMDSGIGLLSFPNKRPKHVVISSIKIQTSVSITL